MEDGGMLAPMAAELVDRLAFLRQFVASLTWVRLSFVVCAPRVAPVCNILFIELLFHFVGFLGVVRREFMQRLSTALHGTLGSYLRDALHWGIDDTGTCLHVPRA
jgi:ABC-type microcin C transport system permease subunit YejE